MVIKMKKIILKLFKIVTLLLFVLSLYILITNNNPIMSTIDQYNEKNNVKIETLKLTDARFYDNSLLTKQDGILNIQKIYTEKGTHLLNDTKTKVLVIKYEFVNNQNKNIRPHATFENNIIAKQNNETLNEGMLELNTSSNETESNLENNSVLFSKPGEKINCLNTFAYDPSKGPITLFINNHKITIKEV